MVHKIWSIFFDFVDTRPNSLWLVDDRRRTDALRLAPAPFIVRLEGGDRTFRTEGEEEHCKTITTKMVTNIITMERSRPALLGKGNFEFDIGIGFEIICASIVMVSCVI